VWRSTRCSQSRFRLNLSTPPKVTDTNFVFRCKQHVLGFQVPVDASMLMHEVNALADLCKVSGSSGLGQPARRLSSTKAAEGASRAMLKDHVDARVILQAGQKPQDVTVLQVSLDPHLPL